MNYWTWADAHAFLAIGKQRLETRGSPSRRSRRIARVWMASRVSIFVSFQSLRLVTTLPPV